MCPKNKPDKVVVINYWLSKGMPTVKKTKRMLTAAMAAGLILSLLIGCNSLSSIIKKPQTLEERVNAYMQTKIDNRWDLAYSFFDSASKKQLTKEQYSFRPRQFSYTGFRIEDINILPSGDRATVKVRIDMLFMGYAFKGDEGKLQRQEWVKEKGRWYVVRNPQPSNEMP